MKILNEEALERGYLLVNGLMVMIPDSKRSPLHIVYSPSSLEKLFAYLDQVTITKAGNKRTYKQTGLHSKRAKHQSEDEASEHEPGEAEEEP